MTTTYEHGRLARSRGCYRVLANPDNEEQRQEWLRGWDDMDAEIRKDATSEPKISAGQSI